MKPRVIITNLIFLLLLGSILLPGKKETEPAVILLAVIVAIEVAYLFFYFVKKSVAVSDICGLVYAFLLVWDVCTKHLGIGNPVLVPPPENVMYVFYTHGGMMLEGVFSSMELMIVGFAVSLTAGVDSASLRHVLSHCQGFGPDSVGSLYALYYRDYADLSQRVGDGDYFRSFFPDTDADDSQSTHH